MVNVLGLIIAVFVIGWILFFLVHSIVRDTVVLWIAGSVVGLAVFAVVLLRFQNAKLEAARREYEQLVIKHDVIGARELCSHKFVRVTQHDMGAVTFTNKWCRTCGKDLGPAKSA